jgi:hypothetical protein
MKTVYAVGAVLLSMFVFCTAGLADSDRDASGVYASGVAVIVAGVLVFVSGLLHSRTRAQRLAAQPTAPLPPSQVVSGDASPLRDDRGARRHPLAAAARIATGAALVSGGVALIHYAASLQPYESHSKGRLLRLRGRAALPSVEAGDRWSDDAKLETQHLSPAVRHALARAWISMAQMEHASIAAFAQLSLHLAALGADSELVERTHRAALDEIRHARRGFAIASAYGGEAVAAGPIAELRTLDGSEIDFIRLAIGTLVDGCLAEGVAADVTRAASTRAVDPMIRETLAMIARDEHGHAELAWDILAWCLDRGDAAVHDVVASRLAALDRELSAPAPEFELDGIPRDQLAEHGILDQETIGEIAARRLSAVKDRTASMLGQLAA